MKKSIDLSRAVQINDGLTQTSADGTSSLQKINIEFHKLFLLKICFIFIYG